MASLDIGTIHVDVIPNAAWHLDDETIERIAQRVAELIKPAPVKLSVAVDPAAPASRPSRCLTPNCQLCR